MIGTHHKIRFVKAIGLVGALAVALAPAAQATVMAEAGGAGGQLKSSAIVDVRSPDRKFEGQYGVQRAMPWHYEQAGIELVRQSGSPRVMPTDYTAAGITLDTPQAVVIDFRSADTRDAVYGRYPAAPILVASGSDGFEWADAGIGAVFALGLVLLLLTMRRFTNRKTQLPSTSQFSA